MPEPKEGTVTVGEVAQQAIERLQVRADTLTQIMGEVSAISADLQDQLRELLSYCEVASGGGPLAAAYDDVAVRLRGILDGEQ